MTQFFRRLRQNFLIQGKTSKYLKYAIGEILLVVIGILIALQINTWNEGRKDKAKEQLILQQLQEEYMANLEQLDEKIAMRTSMVYSSQTILRYIDNPQLATYDSTIYHLRLVLLDPTFDPINNDLISTGNLRLITNRRLNRLLSNWTSDIVAVQETERSWQKLSMELVRPFYIKMGINRDVLNTLWSNSKDITWLLDDVQNAETHIGKTKEPIEVSEILFSKETEGILAAAISLNHVTNIQSIGLRNRILEILDLLEKEIK